MAVGSFGPRRPQRRQIQREKADEVVARARQAQTARERSYREQSLKIHPWVCARCGRTFTNRRCGRITA